MDPLSAIGGVAAVGQIVGAIVKTLKNLSDAKGRFDGADTTIKLLIMELTAVKSALSHIQDWAQYMSDNATQKELLEGIYVSLEGCKLAMAVLEQEVASLVSKNPFLRRAQYTWNEEVMRDHASRLRSQVAALKLLLDAANLRTDMQQQNLLRQPESKYIIQKVVDDTSTLRASIRQPGGVPPTIASHPDSVIGSTVFSMDNELVQTEAYQRALTHQKSKRETEDQRRVVSESTNPFRRGVPPPPKIMTTPSVDSGFHESDSDVVDADMYRQTMGGPSEPQLDIHRSISDSQASRLRRQNTNASFQPGDDDEAFDQLSPMERFAGIKAEDWARPPPFEKQEIVQRPARHATSASDPAIPRNVSFAGRENTLEMKKSLLGTIKARASRVSLGSRRLSDSPSPVNAMGPSPGTRRIKRPVDQKPHISIDFSLPEGFGAPPMVRAAQSGSRPEVQMWLDQRVDVNERHPRSGRSALAVAAHCGQLAIVKLLLANGADVSLKDNGSMSPLHLAASRGHYSTVEVLLSEHADTESQGPDGKTALRISCENGHVRVVEQLLQFRAKINARDKHNLTALHAASMLGDDEIVQMLLNFRADIEARDTDLMKAIHYAARGNHDAVVQTLLANKADIEAQGKQGMTPLAVACSSGALETATVLVSQKANIKAKGEGNMLPIHWAAYNNHEDVLDLLIKHKAAVDAKTKDGRTPLHLSCSSNGFKASELLIRRGASVESECSSGLKPLHFACQYSDADLVKFLLGVGAQVEAEVKNGKNAGSRPLHLATLRGSSLVVGELLARGASVDAVGRRCGRPLSISCTHGHTNIVNMLLEKGAAMQSTVAGSTYQEDSPLCLASKHGQLSVVRLLLSRRADVRQRDEENRQPLHYAVHEGHVDVIKALLWAGAPVSTIDCVSKTAQGFTVQSACFAPEVSRDKRAMIEPLLVAAAGKEPLSQFGLQPQGQVSNPGVTAAPHHQPSASREHAGQPIIPVFEVG